MKRILILLSAVITLLSCGKSEWKYKYASPPGTENLKYKLYDSFVDANGQKGIVVFNDVDPSTNQGSIIVMSLDETVASWGPQDKEVYPISDSELNELILLPGYALDVNHAVNQLGREKYPAFDWCQKKNPSGEPLHGGSWILPGYWEWHVLQEQTQLDVLNEALTTYGGTPLCGPGEYYWTASEDQEGVFAYYDEDDPDYESNWDFNPRERAIHISSDGMLLINKVYWSKSLKYHVRAVKYIYTYEPYSRGE